MSEDSEQQQPYKPPETAGEPAETPTPSVPDADQRTWALLAHLSAFLSIWVPAGNFVGPLIVWILKKDEMPFVDDQGKEALNFQLSLLIYGLVVGALACFFVGFILAIPLLIFAVVMPIIAAVKANEGQYYRYPLTIRILK